MSTLAMFFKTITVGQPQVHANLKIYPLRHAHQHPHPYRTLDEAMDAQEVVVKEVSEGGSVPTLTVQNTGKLPVLIVIGEELIGAKQNRVLNTSVLVPAEGELPIPVSCVEQGRWHYSSRQFASGTTSSHAFLRMAQTERVTENLRTKGRYDADQHAVWSEVNRKMSAHDSSSVTHALHDVYTQVEGKLQDYVDAFQTPEAEGILVVINGRIVGADMFDRSATLHNLWHKLARSYALDALEYQDDASVPEAADAAQQFLALVQNAAEEVYDSVGLGKDVRLTGDTITGSALVWDDQFVHASLFNKGK